MYFDLKEKRISSGLTQEDMAHKLNISLSAYNLKENGVRDFSMDEVKKVLEIFKCEYRDIFFRKVVKNKTGQTGETNESNK